MIRQKERRFAETGAIGFRAPGKLAYFEVATRRLAGNGPVQLSALSVDEEIVATHWGMVADGRFYQLMPSYEGGKWELFSAGRLLHEDLIEWCFANGIAIFDFGIGDEAYKYEYSDIAIPLFRATRAATLRGRLWLASADAMERLRRTSAWRQLREMKVRARNRHGEAARPSGEGGE